MAQSTCVTVLTWEILMESRAHGLLSGLDQVDGAIWGVSQQVKDLSLSATLPFNKINLKQNTE